MTTTARRVSTTARAWVRPLVDLPLLVLAVLLVLGLLGIAQRPLSYGIAIGQEDGWGADLPFAYNWNTSESTEGVRYRWSRDDSGVVLAGLPRQPFGIDLALLPANANPRSATGVMTLSASPQTAVTVPLAIGQRRVALLVPPSALPVGQLMLALRAPTWTPDNDPRTLGVPVDDLQIHSLGATAAGGGLASLPLSPGFFWPVLALVAMWMTLRRWSGGNLAAVSLLAAMAVVLLLAAYFVDRPRFALAARPVVIGLAWALPSALVLRWAIGALARTLRIEATPGLLDLLALLFFTSFTLRYIGRLYPLSMPGDLGFHINREHDVIRGLILLVSRHRGIDFPYPPALYIMLMPFRLLPISADQLVEFTDALFGALGIVPIAYLALAATGEERAARLVAITYALLAPAMMSLWWSFQPHIFAQELVVWLFAGIAWGWRALRTHRGVVLAAAGLLLIFASHFGFYINVSLLLCVLFAFCFVGRNRAGGAETWASARGLLGAFVLAQALVLALFYSGYATLIVDKLLAFEQGGMGAVQGGRQAASQSDLWRTLWQAGFQVHYATIGVPLALLGGYRLWSLRSRSVVPLLCGSLLTVAVAQAAIPFITASTITTRWLSFAASVVAIGIGLLLSALWQRGRGGRLLSLAVLLWIGWMTLFMWVQALGYRVRPPEPF